MTAPGRIPPELAGEILAAAWRGDAASLWHLHEEIREGIARGGGGEEETG